jgi:hypothetical protein
MDALTPLQAVMLFAALISLIVIACALDKRANK